MSLTFLVEVWLGEERFESEELFTKEEAEALLERVRNDVTDVEEACVRVIKNGTA